MQWKVWSEKYDEDSDFSREVFNRIRAEALRLKLVVLGDSAIQ